MTINEILTSTGTTPVIIRIYADNFYGEYNVGGCFLQGSNVDNVNSFNQMINSYEKNLDEKTKNMDDIIAKELFKGFELHSHSVEMSDDNVILAHYYSVNGFNKI